MRTKEGEAEGIQRVGIAEASVVRAKGLAEAEAKEKMAEALNKFNEAAKIIRDIEKDERVGLAGMEALGTADLKVVSTGELRSFTDLFSAKGGANLGAMLHSMQQTDPGALDKIKGILGSIIPGGGKNNPPAKKSDKE